MFGYAGYQTFMNLPVVQNLFIFIGSGWLTDFMHLTLLRCCQPPKLIWWASHYHWLTCWDHSWKPRIYSISLIHDSIRFVFGLWEWGCCRMFNVIMVFRSFHISERWQRIYENEFIRILWDNSKTTRITILLKVSSQSVLMGFTKFLGNKDRTNKSNLTHNAYGYDVINVITWPSSII